MNFYYRICNSNRTEWSPIRSVIIMSDKQNSNLFSRVIITELDDTKPYYKFTAASNSEQHPNPVLSRDLCVTM